jgi:hypothetical protein
MPSQSLILKKKENWICISLKYTTSISENYKYRASLYIRTRGALRRLASLPWKFVPLVECFRRSQWPLGLRRRSAADVLLRLWFGIPPGAWMFVCCECCVLSGRGLCDELIVLPEDSYRIWCVGVCDLETSGMGVGGGVGMARVGTQRHRKRKYHFSKAIGHTSLHSLQKLSMAEPYINLIPYLLPDSPKSQICH